MTDKSINASRTTETPFITEEQVELVSKAMGLGCPHGTHVCFRVNNCYEGGINPTHSLETQVQ